MILPSLCYPLTKADNLANCAAEGLASHLVEIELIVNLI
jgi:hypothetical protein